MSPTFTSREQTSKNLDDCAILLTGEFLLPFLSPSVSLFPNTHRAAHVPCGCLQGPRPVTRRSSPPPQGDVTSPAASASSFLEVRLPSSHLLRTISFPSPLLPLPPAMLCPLPIGSHPIPVDLPPSSTSSRLRTQ